MTLSFAKRDQKSLLVHVVVPESLDSVLNRLDEVSQNWAKSNGFLGNFGQAVVCPDLNGQPQCALLGLGNPKDRLRTRFCLANAVSPVCSLVFNCWVPPRVDDKYVISSSEV